MQIHMHKMNWIQQKHVYLLSYVKLTNQLLFEINLQNGDQHTGPEWLIHGTKHRKVDHFQSLESPVEYHSSEYKLDMQESDGNIFSPILRKKSRGEIILCMMKIG